MGEQQLQPHQERVMIERTELNDKATKLNDFIGHSAFFDSLSSD